jgi:flagellar basal-body rod modification protein FlgD
MSVATIASSNTTAAATTATTTASSSTVQFGADTFLQLLMTQLENQNPLDPMDPTEFTNQLVSYSALEQQIESNTKLDTLTTQLSDLSTVSSLSYLGATAELDTAMAPYQDGQAQWNYSLASNASDVTLTVTDQNGDVVYSGAGETGQGAHALSLSSADLSAAVAEGAALTLQVSAVNTSGQTVSTTITSLGRIDSLESASEGSVFQSGDLTFYDSDIIRLHAAAS